MIIKTDKNDISKTDAKHIAFVINAEGRNQGYNNDIIANRIISRYWPELADCGELELGSVLSKQVGNKNLHALVCYTLDNGWEDNQEDIIKECFDKIPAQGETIATYLFGTHSIDIENGADVRDILRGINESNQKVVLHSGLSMSEVIKYCNNKNQRKSYLITKIEKSQEFVNTDLMALAANAFAIGIGTLGCLYFGNEMQEYYNSSEFLNLQTEFSVRFQDFSVILTSLPVLKGILESVKNFKSLHTNLSVKRNYEQALQTMNDESWTR